MVDPKVVELAAFSNLPHLLVPVVTDPKKAASALKWAVNEMVQRFQSFAQKGARDLAVTTNCFRRRDSRSCLRSWSSSTSWPTS